MAWWGKLIGGAFGFMLGGPLGALLGAALGHNFDRGLKGLEFTPGDQERVQTAFFTATFSVMGYVAKADGRVSPQEIRLAQTVMDQMHLDADKRRAAIKLFDEGKRADFPLDEVIVQFRKECHRRNTLMQMFVEIQLQAAYADGDMHADERRLMLHICDRLGFSRAVFEHLDAIIRASMGADARRGAEYRSPRQTLQSAYQVLDVDNDASDAEVKRAYRRLMSQHHPDKLVSKGLPEEMIELAKQKTQEIRKAYEEVKERRGMR
ncbi:MAG: co-chaperone DjlA [Gammaproteobacteria bacterium]|nr:co-chaperone DjlA [Gammaproteobacteria bacterium]